jgi:hypothetical protein
MERAGVRCYTLADETLNQPSDRIRLIMAGLSHADTLGGYTLTSDRFPDFHARILSLRFPIDVAEVLELRDLINHSADFHEEPSDTPQLREFRESLEDMIHSFGIENRHHCERLLRVLVMLRDLHYQHAIASRDAELRLRQQQAENRMARRVNRRNARMALVLMAITGCLWLVTDNAGWVIKLLPLVPALAALGYFHALPVLDRDMQRLTAEFNTVMRMRVESMDWRSLIHRLALLLGFKQIKGIQVFHHDQTDSGINSRPIH